MVSWAPSIERVRAGRPQEMGCGGTQPSWLAWMAIALPVACLGNVACWALLLLVYRPGRDVKEVRRLPDSEARPRRPRPGGRLRVPGAHAAPRGRRACQELFSLVGV